MRGTMRSFRHVAVNWDNMKILKEGCKDWHQTHTVHHIAVYLFNKCSSLPLFWQVTALSYILFQSLCAPEQEELEVTHVAHLVIQQSIWSKLNDLVCTKPFTSTFSTCHLFLLKTYTLFLLNIFLLQLYYKAPCLERAHTIKSPQSF